MNNLQIQGLNDTLHMFQQSIQSPNQAGVASISFYSQPLQVLSQSVSELITQISQFQTNNYLGKEQTDQIRKRLADIRGVIQDFTKPLVQSESPIVDAYRSAVGTEKDQFESVSNSEQQQMNPQAYQFLQAYNELDRIINLLNQMDAQLMDTGQTLELNFLNR